MVQSMPQVHYSPHPLAGQTVTIKDGAIDPGQGCVVGGAAFKIEDWWDKITGKSWMWSNGNPAALHYAIRAVYNNLPFDDEVVYGKIGSLGHLVHMSEIIKEK